MCLAAPAGAQQRIVQGYEQCLADSLWSSPAPDAAADGQPGSQAEDKALLILCLLQLASQQPAPNLAHLLLGFDVSSGPQGAHLGLLLAFPSV